MLSSLLTAGWLCFTFVKFLAFLQLPKLRRHASRFLSALVQAGCPWDFAQMQGFWRVLPPQPEGAVVTIDIQAASQRQASGHQLSCAALGHAQLASIDLPRAESGDACIYGMWNRLGTCLVVQWGKDACLLKVL